MNTIPETDLILNADGSIYHLNLLPDDIADTIITVGDPDRVAEVSVHFDSIELKKGKREFVTHTGFIGPNRITVISTGIGTDNVDIVLNELDSLANIDFSTRTVREELRSLNIIRIGTSGALQEEIAVDSVLISEHAIGLDSLMHYYTQALSLEEEHFKRAIESHFEGLSNISPYVAAADRGLLDKIGKNLKHGITVTCPGFYAPQARMLRARSANDNLIKSFQNFHYNYQRMSNLEMETAGIYALANVLGHKAISVNAILANRISYEFSKQPQKTINQTIELVLSRVF
ncbi:nucleoside phosphorylase [Paradesertivirga mongoliensis]|uniref:Uridine phosphorylase n=1 Tax=Paradesertivirga mongoliensis TaxID=2100740 RepID=A0ABW4ZNK5_9SPHI|nr:nucleoside phosphorylase [Pedobacter mongoliensis]